MHRSGRMTRRRVAIVAVVLLAGCFDETPDATQGFIHVDAGNVADVSVFLGDDPAALQPGVIGPLDAGTYRVKVVREGYDIDYPDGIDVVVAPADTALARFTLALVTFEAASVSAVDELTGEAIDGGEVFRESSPGTYSSTGLFTPAVVDSVPLGPARFFVRKAGFEDSPIVEAIVTSLPEGEQVPVETALGPVRGVLLEMFTYVVCPNCPYASDSLHALRADLPEETFVIEWHSGVSSLPLYDARWKDREEFYVGKGTAIGYPSTSVAGELPFLTGGQSSDLSEYRPKSVAYLAQCANDCPLVLRLEGTIGATSADLVARIKWRGGSVPGDLVLRVVLIENHVFAPGNEPEDGFAYVARTIAQIPIVLGAPGEVQAVPAQLTLEAWPYSGSPPEYEVVAFIQSDLTKEVLAVSGIR